MADVTLPKLSIDVSKSIIFCLTLICVCVLIGLGKLETDKLQYLLLWLIPSPIRDEKAVTG